MTVPEEDDEEAAAGSRLGSDDLADVDEVWLTADWDLSAGGGRAVSMLSLLLDPGAVLGTFM